MSKFGPDMVAFPDPGEIRPHALAFARMMFAHAAFEREVRELQSDIANEHGFGERKANQWRTPDRAKRMVALIEKKLGKGLPETGPIEKLLTDAVEPCGQRNLLAHGTWWCFDRRTLSIQVRAGYGGMAMSLRYLMSSLHRRAHRRAGRTVQGLRSRALRTPPLALPPSTEARPTWVA